VLVRRHGDFDNAEDAVQDALLAAAVSWPREGVPESPRGWLLQTAERRLIDRWRSERSRRERESRALAEPEAAEAVDADDTLLVLLMCCHPALTPASAIALTLRAAGGLTTAEIASAFLVDETTMAQRISRAKRRVEDSGVPFRLPATGELDERLRTVLHVLYLVFNEGYATSSGAQLQRTELSGEAIRLARLVHRLVPDDPEAAGLLALMLLVDARRPARTDANGEPVPLPDQDRALWDHGRIAEGIAVLDGAAGKGRVGEYRLQAAIAALHDRAPTAADTDWPQILALYGLLEQVSGSPVVTLNKAVAAAMAHSPEAGLAVLDAIDEQLAGSHRLDAVRAHLLEQAGDADGALRHYRAAARRTTNLPERRYLIRRAARLRALSDRARCGARPAASASPPAPPRTRPASRGAP
jgi:RNA polymerase sigma factor (sigma-70 family)